MTERPGREPDRRHHARIEPKGTVTLHALGNAHRGRILNMGAGGMLVATDRTLPDRLLGRTIDLELRFDGPLTAWQRLAGTVGRITNDRAAIVFEATNAPILLRMLDDLTTASHASSRRVSVVLVDADVTRRATISSGFRAAGCEVLEVSRPLEAIVRLGESHFEPDVIAVANSHPASDADEMRAFIEHNHAASLLVTVGPELLDPAGLANWLSSATSTADLPARIRELLFAPRGSGR